VGRSYYNSGRRTEELEKLKEAVRLDPRHVNAYYDLGLTYGDLGKYENAIDAYRQAIQIAPKDFRLFQNLG
jgi:tetratricopeptide (TPR) repeat protein